MELIRATVSNVNITTEAALLTYTYTGSSPIEVMARVDLGDNTGPIAGGGSYTLNIYLDNVCLSPTSAVTVPSGRTKTIVVSRIFPLEAGDVVSIKITGLSSDTSINAIVSLRDVTPAQLPDLVGSGSVLVDQDYGAVGEGRLSYRESDATPVVGAEVRAYLQVDYDAGRRSAAYVVARTTTTTGGVWVDPLALNPATYTFLFVAVGRFGPDTKVATISDPATVPATGFVIATPIPTSATSGATCSDLGTASPDSPTVLGCPTPGAMKALQLQQGTVKVLSWSILDESGNPIDLTSCGSFPYPPLTSGDLSSVSLRVRESLWPIPTNSTDPSFDVDGQVIDASSGTVQFALTADQTRRAGIYQGDIGVMNSDGDLISSERVWIVINRSYRGTDSNWQNGPLTVGEIRLALRDTPGANPLLNEVQFSLAEIAQAISLPIDYWNESPPPIMTKWNTSNFPSRYYWLRGTCALLYRTAALWYMRNKAQLSAGGVQIDDLNKSQEYQAIADKMWDEYKLWVLQTKVQLNVAAFSGSTISRYSYGMWW